MRRTLRRVKTAPSGSLRETSGSDLFFGALPPPPIKEGFKTATEDIRMQMMTSERTYPGRAYSGRRPVIAVLLVVMAIVFMLVNILG